MKLSVKNRIIAILEEHGSMIGNSSEETNQLINELRLVRHYVYDETIETKAIKLINVLCELLDYNASIEENKKRDPDSVLNRDLVCRIVADAFPNYSRIVMLLKKKFNKDRTTIISALDRTEGYMHIQDPFFMTGYQNLMSKLTKHELED